MHWIGTAIRAAEPSRFRFSTPAPTTVLDTRNVTGFQNGQYLVWNINGHVKIVVTTTNPNSNAAISGVFFESSLIGVSVTPQGASLSGGQTQQYTAQVTGTPNKAVTWSISNASNPGNPAPGSISSSGLYTAPASVASAVNLTVTATASDNVTVGTAPLSLTAGTAPSGATATYAGLDTTTQGSWIGTYGGDGYAIPNGAQSVPSYATFAVSGQSSYTWAASTTDVRAPADSGWSGPHGFAVVNATSFTMDVNLKDGNTHQVALYALDWDNYQGGRAEQIQILDASTNNVLDTRSVTGFQNGQYLVWNINGHVKIVVTTNEPEIERGHQRNILRNFADRGERRAAKRQPECRADTAVHRTGHRNAKQGGELEYQQRHESWQSRAGHDLQQRLVHRAGIGFEHHNRHGNRHERLGQRNRRHRAAVFDDRNGWWRRERILRENGCHHSGELAGGIRPRWILHCELQPEPSHIFDIRDPGPAQLYLGGKSGRRARSSDRHWIDANRFHLVQQHELLYESQSYRRKSPSNRPVRRGLG